MAHAASNFDDLFNTERNVHAGEPVRVARWWASWESWLTLTLILLAQLPVIGSLGEAPAIADAVERLRLL